jgi:hypothetical protein
MFPIGFLVGINIVYIVCITIIAYNILSPALQTSESFTTRQTKADAVYNWFIANPTPIYAKFKRDLNDESNIVEFEAVRMLPRPLSLADVEKAIR